MRTSSATLPPRLRAAAATAAVIAAILTAAPASAQAPAPPAAEARPAATALYGTRIVVANDALAKSKYFAPALADLAGTLSGVTGTPFTVTGRGTAPQIRLALASDPDVPASIKSRLAGKGPEPFVIRATPEHLEIVANDAQGLSHGVYFYLEQLGVRWLLPGANWTVLPHTNDIRLSIDRLVEPAYKVRGFAGTGGYYTYIWGRNYKLSADIETGWNDWQRRLRYGGEYQLGKHVGEAFIADRTITPVLAANPDYLAKINGAFTPLYITGRDGKPELNVLAKLNAANPAAIALFCDWSLERLRQERKSPDMSRHRVISVEPSDGEGYADNTAELPGNGSPSDQTFAIVNACARTVRAAIPDASVVALAYYGHAAPPSFALEPNVIVQVTPYGFQSMPPEKFIALWQAKAPRMAMYDYWSIPDWTKEEPTFDFLDIARKLRYWRASNIEGLQAESSFGAGAMGLGNYVAAHAMWALDLDETALIADWYDHAFGAAKAPMQRMMERWAKSFRLTSAELGWSYRDLTEAMRLGASDPPVAARLADVGRYLHYLRLRCELELGSRDADKPRIAEVLAEYLLDTNGSLMVHGTRMIDLYNRRFPGIGREFELKTGAAPGPGWARVRQLTDPDIAALIADGQRSYPPAPFEPRVYSGRLVPLEPGQRWQKPSGDPWGTVVPAVGDLDLVLDMPPGLEALPLRVTRKVDTIVIVDHVNGQPVAEHTMVAAAGAGATWEELQIKLDPGQYRIRFQPAGKRASGYFSFQTWKGVPVTLQTFLSPKTNPSPRLYFYVPKDLRQLVMYYPLGDFDGVFKFQVLQPSGLPAKIEFRDDRRTMMIDVPPGADGKVWSLEHSVSPDEPHVMLNAPQAFALEPGSLLVPVDALQPGSAHP